MKIKSATFEGSAPNLDACKEWAQPEFAFIGRSNVGKSSLINMLAERSGLAKVSNTPGKTQLINFFRINGSWTLVDLPGYGYAKVAQGKRFEFNESVAAFLENRRELRRVFVLIDSMLPPQPIDIEFIRWLYSCELTFSIVFTKTDRQTKGATQKNVDALKAALSEWQSELPPFFTCSAKKGDGRGELLNQIEKEITKR
jgi:GTP-binding protein